jgi:hypothetical protein
MLLRKKPTRTEEGVAARHTSRRPTWGCATAEGRGRIPVVDLASTNLHVMLMTRMEEPKGRQNGRITNPVLKVNRHERQMKALEKGDEKQGRVSGDILENKWVISRKSRPPRTLSHSYRKG